MAFSDELTREILADISPILPDAPLLYRDAENSPSLARMRTADSNESRKAKEALMGMAEFLWSLMEHEGGVASQLAAVGIKFELDKLRQPIFQVSLTEAFDLGHFEQLGRQWVHTDAQLFPIKGELDTFAVRVGQSHSTAAAAARAAATTTVAAPTGPAPIAIAVIPAVPAAAAPDSAAASTHNGYTVHPALLPTIADSEGVLAGDMAVLDLQAPEYGPAPGMQLAAQTFPP